MNNTETLNKMKDLRLLGMFRVFEELRSSSQADSFSHEEFVGHLIDAEWDDRFNRKVSGLIKNATFRYKAHLDEIECSKIRNLDKQDITKLRTCDWIIKGKNIYVTGATGTGKSFLSCALGHQACLHKFKVKYVNCMKLFNRLKLAKADGTYIKEIKQLQKVNVLILDDFGINPFDSDSRIFLLEILEDRYGEKSTIISSQFPINIWHDIIGDKTIADAICDRFIHNAEKIDLKGGSMRKKKNNSGRNLPPEK